MDTTPGGTASSRPRQRGGPPRSVVSPALQAGVPEEVRRRVVPVGKDQRSPVLVELDLTVDVRTEDTRQRFLALYDHSMRGAGAPNPRPVADCYVSCVLNPQEIQDLVAADRATGAARTVFRVWPDYTLHPQRSRAGSAGVLGGGHVEWGSASAQWCGSGHRRAPRGRGWPPDAADRRSVGLVPPASGPTCVGSQLCLVPPDA